MAIRLPPPPKQNASVTQWEQYWEILYRYVTGLESSIAELTAATEVVYAKYSSASGQAIANNTDVIANFETQTEDTHNAVTIGAAWRFTAPFAGAYQVNCAWLFTSGGGWAAGEVAVLQLFKNGSAASNLASSWQTATHAVHVPLNGSTLIRLNASDYLDIRLFQNSGASLNQNASSGHNHISIIRVGL